MVYVNTFVMNASVVAKYKQGKLQLFHIVQY